MERQGKPTEGNKWNIAYIARSTAGPERGGLTSEKRREGEWSMYVQYPHQESSSKVMPQAEITLGLLLSPPIAYMGVEPTAKVWVSMVCNI